MFDQHPGVEEYKAQSSERKLQQGIDDNFLLMYSTRLLISEL